MMKKLNLAIALSLGTLVTTPALAHNLVVNGGFEEPSIQPPHPNVQLFNAIPGWTRSFGSAIEVQDHVAGNPYEGHNLVELDGYENTGIFQDVPTVVGQEYILKFAFSPRPNTAAADNVLKVWWDGAELAVLQGGAGGGNTSWTVHSYSVTASNNTTRLAFQDAGTSNALGTYIDRVSLEPLGVCVLNYDTLAPQSGEVPRILNQLGSWEVPEPPAAPIWQGDSPSPEVVNPWEMEPVVRFLSCYEHRFLPSLADGRRLPVTRENCLGMVDESFIKHDIEAMVKDAYWFPWAVDCDGLRARGIITSGVKTLATGVELTATENLTGGVDLELTTTAEPDTAALLIIRQEKRGNHATEITVVCEFPSGGSPYTCTDNVVGNHYRVGEIEYDGSSIVQNKGVKPKK
jgi:hypothetical protein